MRDLALQRCLNHAEREAVARCPVCGYFFCRECITEHEDRIICAACLARLARVPLLQRRSFSGFIRAGQLVLAVLLAWFFFYALGEALLAVPASFHEGTLWQGSHGKP